MPLLAPHLKKLRAVGAVAATGSTAAAASRLFLSQPAVARAVRDVEDLLGMPLFERGPRGMTATQAGLVLAARVERALAQLRTADRQVSLLAAGQRLAPQRKASQFETHAGYKHLAVLMTLATAGSEKRCAQAMGISQPAVHQALSEMESLSGVRLFHRSARGLQLNEPGEAALKCVKLACHELESANADLAAQAGALGERIVIGSLPYSTGMFLPRAVERLLATHPGVAVTIVDGVYESLLEQLRHADIDVVIGALRNPPPAADLAQETLFSDEFCVVVRNGHPLQWVGPLRWQDLASRPWILPMPNTPAEAAFERAFRAEGLTPPVGGLHVNSPLLTQALLLESDRLVLMSPRQLHREVSAGLLVLLPLRTRMTARSIGVTTRTDHSPSPGMKFLLQALRDEASFLG